MSSEPQPKTPAMPVWFMTVVTVPIVVGLLWVGRGFLIPLAITALLYVLASALVDRIRKVQIGAWTLPSWLANIVSAGIVVGAILLFAGILSASTEEVQEALPQYEQRLSDLADQLEGFLGPHVIEAAKGALSKIQLGSIVGVALSQISGTLATIVLVALYLVFLMTENTKWIEKIPRLASDEHGAATLQKVLSRIADGVKQYMWVNALTSAMSAAVAFLIFSLVDLDFASLLALIVFVAGFIPNIGAFIGIALPSAVALLQFDTLMPFFVVLIGYGLVDQFISNYIQPSMQGRSLNVSTFMVMVFLTFWATVWGGIGAFLAIPMMFVMMVICAEIPATRWIAVLLSSDGKLEDIAPPE